MPAIASTMLLSCMTGDGTDPNCDLIPFNLFTWQQDKDLGLQVSQQIQSTPSQYPIIPEAQNPQAYAHLRRIRDNILNSGKVKNRSQLDWPVYLVKDDNTLNAFCTPGGHIYVYTGIVKFLQTEDDFAGVMGHEIAHADLRHSTKSMTREYGLDLLIKLALGQSAGDLARVATNIGGLSFSRCHETEADNASVDYLSGTTYNCAGAGSFFQKLIDQGQGGGTPEFLSTHPNPDNRVQNINARAQRAGCSTATNPANAANWAAFKTSLGL